MQNNITIVVSHYVKRGKEQEFERALKQVIEQAKSFKGYEGIQTIQVNNKVENEYILLIHFDTEPNYRTWESSNIRRAWSKELKEYIIKESKVRFQEGLEFWFSLPQLSNSIRPKKWKMAILTWMVIYPMILALSTLVGVYLNFMPAFLRILIVSMILVSLMTYLVMPKVTTVFASWIFKK
jgi:antibiotic biosynthesis monooxygenase (ABM) superfamily enzyme